MHTDYLKHCSCIVSTLCVALASVAALHNGASGYRVQLYLIPYSEVNAEAGG